MKRKDTHEHRDAPDVNTKEDGAELPRLVFLAVGDGYGDICAR